LGPGIVSGKAGGGKDNTWKGNAFLERIQPAFSGKKNERRPALSIAEKTDYGGKKAPKPTQARDAFRGAEKARGDGRPR